MNTSTYFTYFDNLDKTENLINFLDSAKKNNIFENIFLIFPNLNIYNSIYMNIDNNYNKLNLKYFILENIINIENITFSELKFYSLSYFLFFSKNNYKYFIDCKLPCIFNKSLQINDLISNNNLNTLYTIKKTSNNYNIYIKNLPIIAQKILNSKLNNMDFDYLHINIYSSYFLNLFFKENKYDHINIIQQTNKFISFIDNDNKIENDNFLPNFYYFYIFFLIINNQLSIYNLSSQLNLPDFFYLFTNESILKIFNYFPFFKNYFIIF